jgi:hypothetical protein
MGFIFNKEINLTPENKKEILRALSAGANANDVMDIFNISKEELESFIEANSDKIINRENFIKEHKGGE